MIYIESNETKLSRCNAFRVMKEIQDLVGKCLIVPIGEKLKIECSSGQAEILMKLVTLVGVSVVVSRNIVKAEVHGIIFGVDLVYSDDELVEGFNFDAEGYKVDRVRRFKGAKGPLETVWLSSEVLICRVESSLGLEMLQSGNLCLRPR